MIRPHRTHPLWFAFLLHRLSGLGLALFLPLHFYMLSLAISAPARLDGFLRFTDLTIVKLAEYGLVFLLAGASIWWASADGIGISAMEPTSENNGGTGGGVCLSSVDVILFESDLIR
jgi:hypothetical protein